MTMARRVQMHSSALIMQRVLDLIGVFSCPIDRVRPLAAFDAATLTGDFL